MPGYGWPFSNPDVSWPDPVVSGLDLVVLSEMYPNPSRFLNSFVKAVTNKPFNKKLVIPFI